MVLVKYPGDVVYDSLINIFPLKHFRLEDRDDYSHHVKVLDSSNYYFVMHIRLRQNTSNTTLVHFLADYPHAISDIGSGGKRAIYTVLEALLSELDKKPEAKSDDDISEICYDVEVVDFENFINPFKSEKNSLYVAVGYILCILGIVLPLFAFAFYDPTNVILAYMAIAGILCSTFAIVTCTLLQISENSKSVMHGRIQTCMFGFSLIIMGYFVHYVLAIMGIVISSIILIYFYKRNSY